MSKSDSPKSSRSDQEKQPQEEKSSGKKAPKVRIERFPIDRSFETESARRGLETLPWSLRLMSASTALLCASIFFSLLSVFFAWRMPPAEVYVSTLDGGLFIAPSVMNPHGLEERFQELDAEATSLKKQAAQPSQGAKQDLPAASMQATGPSTAASSADAAAPAAPAAPGAPDENAVGPATLGGPAPAPAAAGPAPTTP